MIKSFEISAPLPARGSANALRQQLLEHLLKTRPGVGERFLSDHELSRIAGLSRPTVRRALDDLEREGWIERRPGIGTFIGPRAALSIPLRYDVDGAVRRAIRLALLIHMVGDLGHDWYASGVMAGIDQAAEETGVTLELLGDRDCEVKTISRRLLQSRPDVLAFCAPSLRHTILLGEAHRLEIPCIGTGTLLENLGVPTVCEDGFEASREAVRHLVESGHRRIAMILGTFPVPWVFHRHNGYLAGLEDAGLAADECMVLWLKGSKEPENTEQIQRFLQRRQPTAVIFGSWVLVPFLAPLIKSGEISVPRDLSVITFDQNPNLVNWLGVMPTTLSMPLLGMGRQLAHMARDLMGNRPIKPVTVLPCKLVPGQSVRNLDESQQIS